MVKIKLAELGNPVLRVKSRLVKKTEFNTEKLEKLVSKLNAAIIGADGVAIAAPQIGVNAQVVVINLRPTQTRLKLKKYYQVVINPKILKSSKTKESGWEGCLSFIGFRGEVSRSKEIKVRYQDQLGNVHTEIFKDFKARVYQHEIDHLNGLIYLDRMD